MKIENYSIIIKDRIEEMDRINWTLDIDAVYCADKEKAKNVNGEVISKLLPVKNQGGFRYLGDRNRPKLIMIYTSGEDIYWPDELDNTLGILLYYGDNRKPGTDLHQTNLHGNEILRNIFAFAASDDKKERSKIPPIFVFKKVKGRDVKFLGLAVPGIKGKPKKDWLTAVWGCTRNGNRFQNYKSFFTILDGSKGSEKFPGKAGINLAWITDILKENSINSQYAPIEWKKFINGNNFAALVCKIEKNIKTKEEQLPNDKISIDMLEMLQSYFVEKDHGYSFENFANDMAQFMDGAIVGITTTRPYKDGGYDGIGKYKIFNKSENEVLVDFYLQAKCYSISNSVGVADMARLISRIKDRQFGIMFTTSYIARQAYEELLDDEHPIVIVNGKIIIDYLRFELDINGVDSLKKWLIQKY